MSYSPPFRHLYWDKEPLPHLATLTICQECFVPVLTEHQTQHTEWHQKIDQKISDIWERLNEGDL